MKIAIRLEHDTQKEIDEGPIVVFIDRPMCCATEQSGLVSVFLFLNKFF